MKYCTLFFVFAIVACNSSLGTKKEIIDRSPQLMLGVIDTKEATIKETDKRVVAIKLFMDSLAAIYNEPNDTIAEYTSRVQAELHNKGIEYPNQEILKNMCLFAKKDANMNMKYKDACHAYSMTIPK